MYYQHFLGVDVLELAARVSDAAAVTAKYQIPTMQASECVVCHKTLDPVAGLFQDYWQFADRASTASARAAGSRTCSRPASRARTCRPTERWRALQWLGERTAKDPRFAVAMVEHVYYILTGRKVLLPPKDLDDPLYAAKRRAYQEQRRADRGDRRRASPSPASTSRASFKDWIVSDFYRADGLATALERPEPPGGAGRRRASCGCSRPEQVERKVAAVFGEQWGKLARPAGDALRRHRLEGGHRAGRRPERGDGGDPAHPVQRRGLQARRCATSPARPPSAGCSPASSRTSCPAPRPRPTRRSARRSSTCTSCVLGRYDAADSAEVDAHVRALRRHRRRRRGAEGPRQARDLLLPGRACPTPPDDPHYTIRAWRGVVTYLLRRPEFLYE